MFAKVKVETVLVFFFLLPFIGKAQEVIVCRTQQSGIPREAAIEWTVDSFPAELTLFYHNGKTTISERNLNFIIEPEKKLGLAPFEASIVVSQGRNWASVPFSFPRAGKYVISTYRLDKSVLATTLISIDGPEKQAPAEVSIAPRVMEVNDRKESAATETRKFEEVTRPIAQVAPATPVQIATQISAEEQKTLTFAEVNIAFGTAVKDKKLENVSTTFTDAQTRKGILVQLSDSKPFATDAVSLDIWKKSSASSTDYDELVLNQKVDVKPKSYTVQAPITLFKKGEYKVSFFTPDFVWISSAYLTVN